MNLEKINGALDRIRAETDQHKAFRTEHNLLYLEGIDDQDLYEFEELARKEFDIPTEVMLEAQNSVDLLAGNEEVESLSLFPHSNQEESNVRPEELNFERVLLDAWLDRYKDYLRHYQGSWWGLTKQGHWISGVDATCMSLMDKTARDVASDIKGKRERKRAYKQLNFHIVQRVLKQASAMQTFEEEGFHKGHPEKPIFDQHKHLLGVRSGVVDLRTGRIRAAQPNEYVHKRLSYDPGNAAECPNFERVLQHASQGDEATYDYLLSFFGLCLTGEIEGNHHFPFLHGEPGTGKSTLTDCMLDILEYYAANVESEHFIKTRYQPHTQWLAGLCGTRLVVISELPDRATWDTRKLNRITDGSRITANRMRENDIQFDSQMKVIVCGNHEPKFDVRDGISRRVLVLKMDTTPSKIDLNLKDRLREERSAILKKLIDKTAPFYTTGQLPPVPDLMRSATDQYVHEQDTVKLFVEEQCILGQQETISLKEIYERYKTVCEEEGRKSLTKQKFKAHLLSTNPTLHFEAETRNKRLFKGITLADPNYES
ncbi:MAG: phage/plasmid primase, P4 family [Gammaproteobacteria bacterium]|nr:phage/plasmid primase, P4 family [Gammaproteobacteria bacterium]